MRMAQTRGGKTFWRGWSASTKGWGDESVARQRREEEQKQGGTYHSQCPDGVVKEDSGGGHKHGEADNFVKLRGSSVSRSLGRRRSRREGRTIVD